MKNNLYVAAWTIIQNCCEASVTADLMGEQLIAHLANAAASRAAEWIGIPERELHLIRQLMSDEMRTGMRRGNRGAERRDTRCRNAANENEPNACVRPPGRIEPEDAPRIERREGAAHRLDR